MKCPLCKEKNSEDLLVIEDNYSFCVVSKWPLKKGHLLVLPKAHKIHLTELNKDESKSLLDMIHNAKNLLKKAYGGEVICVKNNGKHCSQEHLHFHVIISKGNLRSLISSFENREFKPNVATEEMIKMKDEIRNFI